MKVFCLFKDCYITKEGGTSVIQSELLSIHATRLGAQDTLYKLLENTKGIKTFRLNIVQMEVQNEKR